MWICPRCNQKFVNRNQSHSCGQFSVAGFLKGKSRTSVRLFRAFLKAYKEIGPYEVHPVKSRVALLMQMRFASVNKLGGDYLDGHFVLVGNLPDESVIYKIDNLNDRFFVHHFRIRDETDINRKLRKYMRLAYDVGLRRQVGETRFKRGRTTSSRSRLRS